MGPTIALIIALGCFILLGFILRRAGQKGQAKGINIAERDERLRRVARRARVFAGAGAAIGFYGAVVGSRDLFATGFAFAIVEASWPLFFRLLRR